MWKKIRPLLPHAAIILADAYVVFFLIDRVNTAMNFIDNGLTKGLLLLMSLLTIFNWRCFRPRRIVKIRDYLPPVGAGMCAACLILLLADAIRPGWSLFLKPAVKGLVLICCGFAIAGNAALIARQRRLVRRRQRKAQQKK